MPSQRAALEASEMSVANKATVSVPTYPIVVNRSINVNRPKYQVPTLNQSDMGNYRFKLVLIDMKPVWRFNYKTGRKEYLMTDANMLGLTSDKGYNCIYASSPKSCRAMFEKYIQNGRKDAKKFNIESLDTVVKAKIQDSFIREFCNNMGYDIVRTTMYKDGSKLVLDTTGQYNQVDLTDADEAWSLLIDLQTKDKVSSGSSSRYQDIQQKWTRYDLKNAGNKSGLKAYARAQGKSKMALADTNVLSIFGMERGQVRTGDPMISSYVDALMFGKTDILMQEYLLDKIKQNELSLYLHSFGIVSEVDAIGIFSKEFRDAMKLFEDNINGVPDESSYVKVGPYGLFNEDGVVKELASFFDYYMAEANIELGDYYAKNKKTKSISDCYLTRSEYIESMTEYVPIAYKFRDVYHPVFDRLTGPHAGWEELLEPIPRMYEDKEQLGLFGRKAGTILIQGMPKVNAGMSKAEQSVQGFFTKRSYIPQLFNGYCTPYLSKGDTPLNLDDEERTGITEILMQNSIAGVKDYYSFKFFGGIVMAMLMKRMKELGYIDKDSLIPIFNDDIYKLEFSYSEDTENGIGIAVAKHRVKDADAKFEFSRFKASQRLWASEEMPTTLTAMHRIYKINSVDSIDRTVLVSNMENADVAYVLVDEMTALIAEYVMQTRQVVETLGTDKNSLFNTFKVVDNGKVDLRVSETMSSRDYTEVQRPVADILGDILRDREQASTARLAGFLSARRIEELQLVKYIDEFLNNI